MPSWLPSVPDVTNNPAGNPRSAATSASSALTVGSSPYTSSPTSASAIAIRMPALGRVIVSLRRSTTGAAHTPRRRPRSATSRSATRKASSSDCSMFNRGSQAVS